MKDKLHGEVLMSDGSKYLFTKGYIDDRGLNAVFLYLGNIVRQTTNEAPTLSDGEGLFPFENSQVYGNHPKVRANPYVIKLTFKKETDLVLQLSELP